MSRTRPYSDPSLELPLYLIPNFVTRFSSLVVVQWFGIHRGTQSVSLQVVCPIDCAKTSLHFESFEDCVKFILAPNMNVKNIDVHFNWWAFSYRDIETILTFYKEQVAFGTSSNQRLHEFMAKYQFPLQTFFHQIQSLPPLFNYHFEQPSDKHARVARLNQFIMNMATPSTPIKSSLSVDPIPDVVMTTAPTLPVDSSTMIPPPPQTSSSSKKWTDKDWKVEKRPTMSSYFANVCYREQTKFAADPQLIKIVNWRPLTEGYDMEFDCEFEHGQMHTLHYTFLQCNAAYNEILKLYMGTNPTIQQRLAEFLSTT